MKSHPPIRINSVLAFTALTLAAALLLPRSLSAKGGPNVNLDEPVLVEVQGPVEVIGAVEILAEPVKQPFHQMRSATIEANAQNQIIDLDLPEGKIVVVETVTIVSLVPLGGSSYGWLVMNGKAIGAEPGFAALTFHHQGTHDGKSMYVSSAPLTLRIDPDRNALQAVIFRTGAGGIASCSVSIFGYLEDR